MSIGASVYRHVMDTNERPRRTRMEDKIDHKVLPVLYVVAVLLGVLILAALTVLAWGEVF
jgi:hypothetical protein